MCDVCQNVHSQIRRYQQCQEESQQFVLTKGDVMANVLFPVAWNHRQCLCCFKETKNYESYNNIIQMVINTAIRLLQKYNDDASVLKDCVSVAEVEAQCDVEVDDAIWSMAEFEQLIIFISSSLIMSFPLYIICKHNHICGVEELSTQETSILASYCDINDTESLPVMLLRNVCFFCDSGGPQAIKKCLEERAKELTTTVLGHIIQCLSNLKHWLTMNAIESYIFPLKPSLVKYMCSMSDDKLRQAGSRNITELVMSLIKEPNPVKALFDNEYLKLSFKYFSSSTLTIRMAGLQQLNSRVAVFNEALSVQAEEEMEAAGELLAEWLITNRIIEHIFGPNLHNELVKQSQIVLNFLASEGKITVEHIDTMWSAAMQKHCSRQVLDVLILLVKHLTIKPLVHLMDLLYSLEVQAHTEQTLLLVSSITKKFWSIPSREEKQSIKTAASSNQEFVDTSLENEISVCSSEEDESDDSNESCKDIKSIFGESDGELERPKRSIPVNLLYSMTEGDENPVEAVYGGVCAHQRKASINEMDSSSVGETTGDNMTSDSEASPMKPRRGTHYRVCSSRDVRRDIDSDIRVQMLGDDMEPDEVPPLVDNPLLPVTIEDLESAMDTSGGGVCVSKMVHTPSSSPAGSAKSEKNMADFEGEDYMSEEELSRIGGLQHQETHQRGTGIQRPCCPRSPPQATRGSVSGIAGWSDSGDVTEGCNSKYLDVSEVTQTGHTLLWDLIQDDMAPMLPEGLVFEAEKLLSSLLCTPDMALNIKLEFIQACINNINLYRSSTISLRLLPKLISSFQHPFRSNRELHQTTLYIEETYNMMTVFFINLVQFRHNLSSTGSHFRSLCGMKTDIQVRLHFLSFIYSYVASPESFCLNREQIDIIWKCLAMDKDTSDHVLNWLYTQVTGREFHALNLDIFKYIYTEKLTQLSLKDMTMTGFNLFHLLHEMLSQSNLSDSAAHDKQLWDVALKSQCTEVSLAAIDYLNNCYMNDNDLSREPEFIDRCMKCLLTALDSLNDDCETSMQVIDRGLYLLKNHIESFRQKYAFQLKMWQLKGGPIVSHQCTEEKGTQLIKLILSAPSLTAMKGNKPSSYKVTVEVLSSVLLGELRADVTNWWHKLVRQQQKSGTSSSSDSAAGSGGRGEPASSTQSKLSNETYTRLMTNGQELGSDMDKKSLQNLQFKNDQVVIVSVSSNRAKLKQEAAAQLPLVTHLVPMMILVQEPHFENLFNMLQVLSDIQRTLPVSTSYRHILCNRARVLSRRVWDLLMVVPTNPTILQSISKLSSSKDKSLNWELLLDSSIPSKLVYSLQIIESLSGLERKHKPSLTIISETDQVLIKSDADVGRADKHLNWSRKFIMEGGLLHLFEILADRRLEESEIKQWSEWHQEALSYLLRLLCQFAVIQFESGEGDEAHITLPTTTDISTTSPSKLRSKSTVIPKLNKMILDMIESRYADIFNIIHTVIYESILPVNHSPFWGRLEVVHQAMAFLVYWAYSDRKVEESLRSSEDPTFLAWLKRLTLQAPESQIRQEACKSLYRLCLGQPSVAPSSSSPTTKSSSYAVIVLSTLLELLPIAVSMEPLMCEAHEPTDSRKSKLGASCQDYLWLTSQLLDNMDDETRKQFDLNKIAELVRQYISSRRFYEERHSAAEDEGLIGLLNLQAIIIKHNADYKNSPAAQELLGEIFDDLFLLPCIQRRHLPKCKSNTSRCSAYDLLVELVKGSPNNYMYLHTKLVEQHGGGGSYPWDYWPVEDVRSVSGYVGLQNLGATCYMATCMQHLYMIPQARQSILSANCDEVNLAYSETLREMKKMFAYLMESERKSYNPQNYCKVYEMDRQPLNTGEQKDMTEFFTDLITKLEEMSPELKCLVKDLFGGVISNNVVSLDCPHVSRTLEEFYTIRCQVADMKTLYESLDEVCVKDTLDGDNMYTCSKCQKKVRAEKRACFKHLPKILCFNTMRYTFNMVTMLKEKINTLFSFPHQLNMADYMERNLLQPDKIPGKTEDDEGAGSDDPSPTPPDSEGDTQNTEYELIGVTVHTGTADGGHYYSFIRDRIACEPGKPDKWFLFNDSEVKPFDPAQIAQECFGGEMTNTTYDTIADKFVDFSFEKTNSAYMLFYERVERDNEVRPQRQSTSEQHVQSKSEDTAQSSAVVNKYNFELSDELAEWIWKDNTAFLQDKNIFCHNYFTFMWQMCAYIPTTLPRDEIALRVLPAQLSSSFLLETFIHAKEKPTMVQWIELLTKQFNQCHAACEWLLKKMTCDDHWSKQILIGCSNQTIRQMFQRLIMHVITQLRNKHYSSHGGAGGVVTQPWLLTDNLDDRSVVSGFICKQLQILQQPDMQLGSGCKYLAEYFTFLYDFARLGAEEKRFLINNDCISIMISFYIGGVGTCTIGPSLPERPKSSDSQCADSSDDEEDDVLTVFAEERLKLNSLEKMINIIAVLVENSRVDRNLQLSDKDMDLLVGGKGMKFIVNQIKDNINPRQTCQLIFSLSRWNEELATAIVNTILHNAVKSTSPFHCQAFLKVLTMTTELPIEPPGHPHFTELILNKFWLVCDSKPLQFLEWMSNLVCHNPVAHGWMLDRLRMWVEPFLLKHSVHKVRTWAMLLLVSLVPSPAFRNFARTGQTERMGSCNELTVKSQMTSDALAILHDIYTYLLELMPLAKQFADVPKYGTNQLVSYLTFLSLCLLSKEEKLMFSPYFPHLWQMFQPKMTDPQVAINQNKQALLIFWYHSCVECPENIQLIITNQSVTKNIAFNYILADHDDQDVVAYNRCMLPAYYSILKMCCRKSRLFTRHLATHQNLTWAFQHIVPFPTHYSMAVDELLAILNLIVTSHPDSTAEEDQAITETKHKILSMYQHVLNPRSDWQTLIIILKILLVTDDDVYTWVLMSGLASLSEAFNFVHGMYHAVTACHVLTDICDCLSLICKSLKVANDRREDGNDRTVVYVDGAETTVSLFSVLNTWDRSFLIKNCLTLLNSYSPAEVRSLSIDVLKKLVLLVPETVIGGLAAQLLPKHVFFQGIESPSNHSCMLGPYLPTRASSKTMHPSTKINVKPSHPQFGMFLHHNMIMDRVKGQDAAFDQALAEFYAPYQIFVDFMMRVAVNKNCVTNTLVNLSALVAYEGIHLHSPYFAKLWCEIYQAEKTDKDYIKQLCNSSYLIDYMEAILHDERTSLNSQHIHQFFNFYFKLVHQMVLCEESNESSTESMTLTASIIQSIVLNNLSATNIHHHFMHKSQADLRALLLIYQVAPPTEYDPYVVEALTTTKKLCMEFKNRLNKVINESLQKELHLKGQSGDSTEDLHTSANQRSREVSEKSSPATADDYEEDQQVPTKKRRVSPPHTATSDIQTTHTSATAEHTPKVTIEHRPQPIKDSSSRVGKGSGRSGPVIDKGKGPAKKQQQHGNRTQSRSMVKSSKSASSLTSSSPEDNNQSDDSKRGISPQSLTCNAEISKAKRRLEQVDHVLDIIGAVLAMIANLEGDDSPST